MTVFRAARKNWSLSGLMGSVSTYVKLAMPTFGAPRTSSRWPWFRRSVAMYRLTSIGMKWTISRNVAAGASRAYGSSRMRRELGPAISSPRPAGGEGVGRGATTGVWRSGSCVITDSDPGHQWDGRWRGGVTPPRAMDSLGLLDRRVYVLGRLGHV